MPMYLRVSCHIPLFVFTTGHNAIEAMGAADLAAAWELGATPHLATLSLSNNSLLEWGVHRLGAAVRLGALPSLTVRRVVSLPT